VVPVEGPAPEGVVGSFTDHIENPRLSTLEVTVAAPPPFTPPRTETCPTVCLWWRKLDVRPLPCSFVSLIKNCEIKTRHKLKMSLTRF
jgi:hypothetical protein